MDWHQEVDRLVGEMAKQADGDGELPDQVRGAVEVMVGNCLARAALAVECVIKGDAPAMDLSDAYDAVHEINEVETAWHATRWAEQVVGGKR